MVELSPRMDQIYNRVKDSDVTESSRLKNESSSRLEELKNCFESNIYSRIAGSEEGSLFMGALIASLQFFIPIRIIIDNFSNYDECRYFGDYLMAWDTVIIGTALIYLLWLTIINQTISSIRGFEYLLGLENIPRRWALNAGIIITPVSNCLTGIAATVVLLSAEVSIVDMAKDSMALFFIIRLDEDFGKLHTLLGVFNSRFGYKKISEFEYEEDDETADRLLETYGPWNEVSKFHLIRQVVFIFEVVCFLASFIIPFIFFACAV